MRSSGYARCGRESPWETSEKKGEEENGGTGDVLGGYIAFVLPPANLENQRMNKMVWN